MKTAQGDTIATAGYKAEARKDWQGEDLTTMLIILCSFINLAMFDDWISAPAVALAVAYSWLSHNLGAPFAAFAKDFQFAAILTVTLIFIMVSLFIMLRQAKRKLPKSYVVEIIDVYGETVTIDGVRQVFRTYEAAESYARMYRQNFSHYRFKVVGSQNVISETPRFTLW